MKHDWRPAALVVMALILGGCGGGGGGGGGQNLATITAANAVPVAETVVGAVSISTGVGDLGEALVDLGGIAPRAVALAASRALRTAAAVFGPVTEPCDLGVGTITLTWNDADSSLDLSPGDLLTAEPSGCLLDDSTDPVTLDGSMSLRVVAIALPFDFTVDASFQPLTGSEASGDVISVRGSMRIAASATDGVVFASRVSGTSVSATVTDQGSTSSGSLRNFDITTTIDTSTGQYAVSGTGMASSSNLEGAFVQFETGVTVPALSGVESSSPTSGAFFVTGEGSATLTLAATGAGGVELRLDNDGDEQIDETIPSTWDDLGF